MLTNIRKVLFWKVALYYGGLLVLLMVLVGVIQPDWLKYFPLGGLEGLSSITELTGEGGLAGQVPNSSEPHAFSVNVINLFSAMTGTLIVMIPLRWVYMTDNVNRIYEPDLATGLLVLPLVVTAVAFLIKYSLPLAFALAGIFAGIRYKSELKNNRDTHFIFVSIGVGLAIGAGSLGIALVLAAFFALTILIVSPDVARDPSLKLEP